MENKRPTIILVNRCFILNNENKILLIKRCPTDRKDPDKWEIPGGKLDEGEDLSLSKNREVFEETGLLIKQTKPLVFTHSYVIEDGGYKGFTYLSIFSINKKKKGKVILSEEHSEFVWVTYGEMLKYKLTDEVKKASKILKDYLLNS